MNPRRTYLDYTFDDETFEPFGRQIDARVYFHWRDFDPADDSDAGWGAVIDDVEVVGVRHFDGEGNPIPVEQFQPGVGWELLQQQLDLVREACTEEGARLRLGRSHPLYQPRRPITASASNNSIAPRLAPSIRRRNSSSARRSG